MALIRILVDGYSLLHSWPELAPGKPRYSQVAREELIYWLTQYGDAIATPVTVIFDGAGAPTGTPKPHSTPNMEILFSSAGHTADDLIERAAVRLKEFGDVLVVTDDGAERETVISGGGHAVSCLNFINTLEATLKTSARELIHHNQKELRRWRKGAL